MRVVRERLSLLRTLGAAGPRLIAVLVALLAAGSLLPAASAVLMGLLVARVHDAAPPWSALAAFLAVLLAGHLVDAFANPLSNLVKSRIDGAQRAEVARLTSASPTIGALEEPAVQDLIRTAAADPVNWTEKTPGDGALAQLGLLFKWLGALGAGAVLAAYAWWMLPVLLIPVVAARSSHRRSFLKFARMWVAGQALSRRSGGWRDTMLAPAGGKEQRVYGLGDWAVGRQQHAIHQMFDPLWAHRRTDWVLLRGWTIAMLVPLGLVYAVVTVGVAHGHTSVATQTAVLAAGFAVIQALGGYYDTLEIENSLPTMHALPKLRAALADSVHSAQPGIPAQRDTATPTGSVVAHADGRTRTAVAVAVADSAAPHAGGAPPRVELRGIRFAYPGTERAVLDGLDLTINPGELLAIVGLNGAGKSTLIKILSGLYRPDAGTVTADGVDLDEIGPTRWRERISVVFQDFVRYHLTAADNVALGHATVPRDQPAIEAAATEAGLAGVLERLPHGWDTPLARDRTDGVDLSGGQWQQVVLARALYSVRTGAGLLVLDEPTAHLDVRSEQELFDRLLGRRGTTSIVLISHRLSTVRQADRIVLLDGGRITESGTHAELLALGGGYAGMFTIQAERFTRGYDDRIEEDEL